MKKIRQLNLSPGQLLSLGEQEKIVAGTCKRVKLVEYGSCNCSSVGAYHKISEVYYVSTDYMETVKGIIGVTTGAIGIVSGLAGEVPTAGGSTVGVILGIYSVEEGLKQITMSAVDPHFESDIITSKCVKHNGHQATAHTQISKRTVKGFINNP